jgi:hypothetical protein
MFSWVQLLFVALRAGCGIFRVLPSLPVRLSGAQCCAADAFRAALTVLLLTLSISAMARPDSSGIYF